MRKILYALKTDESLMLAYGQGDTLAFEVLYLRYKDKLFRFISRSCQPASLAEDIAHEAWTSIIRSAGNYQVRGKFKTWLFGIARNKLIDHWRSNRSEENFEDDGTSENTGASLSETIAKQNPEMLLQREVFLKLARGQLSYALSQLPAEQRDVILLREEGFTHEEMAKIIGTGKETVKSRLRYASASLRKLLDHQLTGELS